MDAPTEPSVVTEVRLTAFKSFRNAVLPLDALTLIVGRNGSGKSNALDGLWVLARLAQGLDLRESLDGRDDSDVRGGSPGCPPFGERTFQLGASVRTGARQVDLDVTVSVGRDPQVISERLVAEGVELLATEPPNTSSADISATWRNKKKGPNPAIRFRADRLLSSQVLSRIPATAAGQELHLAAAQVLTALKSVFVLDPVPHLMRQYVQAADVELRRNASNLSAAVSSLLGNEDTRVAIVDALQKLNEQQIIDVTTSESGLGDVMLTVKEQLGDRTFDVPARVMSDGTLRFLAILTSVLQAPTLETSPDRMASDDAEGQTTVVIEELENGLHASQASTLVAMLRDEIGRRRVRALATSHSPAVLDSLRGEEHRSVVVCQRDAQGTSSLTRLTDLPDYWQIAAKSSLGRAAEDDLLRALPPTTVEAGSFLDDLLGPAQP